MQQTSAINTAALTMAQDSREGAKRSGDRAVYPGSDKREFGRWYITSGDEHELIIANNPVQIVCYRTACQVRRAKSTGALMCEQRLQRCTKYRLETRNNTTYKKQDPAATDLYAEAWYGNEPELWTILPVVHRTPVVDADGNVMHRIVEGKKIPIFNSAYKFVEIESGSDLAAVIKRTAELKFFAEKKTGLIGAYFRVTRNEDRGQRMGIWTLMMSERPDGAQVPRYIDPAKLFQSISDANNKQLTDEQRKKGMRKLYYASIDEAYPFAKVDAQRAVLQTHVDLINGNPDFRKFFPEMTKSFNSTGGLVDVSAGGNADGSDGFDADNGQEMSVDALDENTGDNSDPVVDFDSSSSGEAGEETAEEAGEEVGEDEAAAEAPAAVVEDTVEGDEDAPAESATEDGQQDDGPVDLDGNKSAFDFTEDEESAPPKKAAVTAKAVPTGKTAKAVAAPATAKTLATAKTVPAKKTK